MKKPKDTAKITCGDKHCLTFHGEILKLSPGALFSAELAEGGGPQTFIRTTSGIKLVKTTSNGYESCGRVIPVCRIARFLRVLPPPSPPAS